MAQSYPDDASRERIARLMAEAMRRDGEGQRELIQARARGETDAVYWEPAPNCPTWQELYAANRRLRDQLQCTLIRVHLAIESTAAVLARCRETYAASQASGATISATLQA